MLSPRPPPPARAIQGNLGCRSPLPGGLLGSGGCCAVNLTPPWSPARARGWTQHPLFQSGSAHGVQLRGREERGEFCTVLQKLLRQPFFPLGCFPCKTKHGLGRATDLENTCREYAPGAEFGRQPLKRGGNFHQHMAADAEFTCVLPWVFCAATQE